MFGARTALRGFVDENARRNDGRRGLLFPHCTKWTAAEKWLEGQVENGMMMAMMMISSTEKTAAIEGAASLFSSRARRLSTTQRTEEDSTRRTMQLVKHKTWDASNFPHIPRSPNPVEESDSHLCNVVHSFRARRRCRSTTRWIKMRLYGDLRPQQPPRADNNYSPKNSR